jgi:hypothetical protein
LAKGQNKLDEGVEEHCRKEQMKRRVSRLSEEVSTGIRIGYLFHEDKKKSRRWKCVFFKTLLIS